MIKIVEQEKIITTRIYKKIIPYLYYSFKIHLLCTIYVLIFRLLFFLHRNNMFCKQLLSIICKSGSRTDFFFYYFIMFLEHVSFPFENNSYQGKVLMLFSISKERFTILVTIKIRDL